jgi:arylsulfatase A-like enzyme
VVIEYAQNDEAMIRDRYWKLIYERNARERTDGYATGRPLKPHQLRLYDLHNDPSEMRNVADDPANAAEVERLRGLLVDHLVKTARELDQVPFGADALTILDHCVQPRDVGP